MGGQALHAATLDGKARCLLQTPTNLMLRDVYRDGRVLLESGTWTNEVWGRGPDDAVERPYSWLDGSGARGVSPDGRNLLLAEYAVGGGVGGTVWLRRMDGTAPVLLGSGLGHGLSPDGRWAITDTGQFGENLVVLPTGPGQAKKLPRGDLETHYGASFFPDNRRILVLGSEPGRPQRLFCQDVDGGPPRTASPEGFRVAAPGSPVSPDGTRIAAFPDDASQGPVLVSVEDGTVRSIDGLGPGDMPLAWTMDGRSLFVREPSADNAWRVVRFNVETRKRTLWKELRPVEPSGARVVYNPVIARNGEVYFYTVFRNLSNLYVVEGLR